MTKEVEILNHDENNIIHIFLKIYRNFEKCVRLAKIPEATNINGIAYFVSNFFIDPYNLFHQHYLCTPRQFIRKGL